MLSLPPHLRQEYFASAPQEEREAADALMEREFGRLAQLNEGVIDDAVKQVCGAAGRARLWPWPGPAPGLHLNVAQLFRR